MGCGPPEKPDPAAVGRFPATAHTPRSTDAAARSAALTRHIPKPTLQRAQLRVRGGCPFGSRPRGAAAQGGSDTHHGVQRPQGSAAQQAAARSAAQHDRRNAQPRLPRQQAAAAFARLAAAARSQTRHASLLRSLQSGCGWSLTFRPTWDTYPPFHPATLCRPQEQQHHRPCPA